MNKTVLIPEFDEQQMATGFMWVTKVDEKGPQRGLMPVSEVADVMREFVNWDAGNRQVKLITRFADSPFLAWGQNGAKWVAVKVIEPAEYFLLSVSGQAYQVKLPRLIAKVGSHTAPHLYWTDAEQLALDTKIYPLMIGNIDSRGWVCLGTAPLKCKDPESIDSYVRQVVEIPATGTYLSTKTDLEKLYRALTRQWAPGIGREHAITIATLLKRTGAHG